MTDEYEVPKREVEAEIVVAGEEPRPVRLFLAERAQKHSGPERPSDLLNAAASSFFPVRETDAGLTLVRRSAVLVLSVPASEESGPEQDVPPAGSTEERSGGEEEGEASVSAASGKVVVRLEDGRELSGTVRVAMPAGARRIQDFLNRADAFVRLRDGDTVRFVNRERIAHVSLL